MKACPNCGISWESENTMIQDLEATGLYSGREAEVAANYGWTEENNLRFGKNVVGMYSLETDRTEYWHCKNCGEDTPR